jgi:hypothetical protein
VHGYTVRVLPRHEETGVVFMPGLIAWADPDSGSLVDEIPAVEQGDG